MNSTIVMVSILRLHKRLNMQMDGFLGARPFFWIKIMVDIYTIDAIIYV